MRKKAQENLSKYDKNMQKKLVQLENNICQLTHSYYDLVVVQQRYKVDNAFLKKNLEVKDVTILSLKKKIKDLEDQNRDLEDQKWGEEDLGSYALDGIGNLGLSNMGKISLRKSDIDESSKQFQ